MPTFKHKKSRDPEKKRAVAVKYDRHVDRAPRVIAKGEGHLADKIIELAKEHKIPLHEDKALSEALSALELDQEIPSELFRAVAEVLVFIYRLNKKKFV